jgi:Fic family protein
MADKKTIAIQQEKILIALKQFSKGASIEEIQKAANLDIDTRQFQRRLNALIDVGQINRTGKSRGTKYHQLSVEKIENSVFNSKFVFSISKEGEEIIRQVSSSEEKRTSVSYNKNFLESYKPNVDFYLSSEQRENLRKIGRIGDNSIQEAGTYAKQILQKLLIDLSWNSSRLEGNTYSLLETEELIEFGKEADNKSAMEAQMILNHKEAIEFIVQSADEIGYNRYTILNLHALLANNLLPDPSAPGRLRKIPVGIKKSVYTPTAIPQVIEEMFELILQKAREIIDPFEQAFFIMVHLPYLQPFEDVNKRTSRIAMNIAFNYHNLSPLSFIDVSHELYIQGLLGVYELNRIELLRDIFIWAYNRSSTRYASIRQTVGEPDPFRLKYRSEIKEMITKVVVEKLNRTEAVDHIEKKSKKLSQEDQQRFVEAVETELLNLHEGNYARYWIKPSQFKIWKENWAHNND